MQKIYSKIIVLIIAILTLTITLSPISTYAANETPKVCVFDNFKNSSKHGDIVVDIIKEQYKGKVYKYDNSEYDLLGLGTNYKKNKKLLSCDVINFSQAILFDEETVKRDIVDLMFFLDHFDGLVIAAAGNEGSSTYSSPFARLEYIAEEYADKFILVHQSEKVGEVYHEEGGWGKEVDITVDNKWKVIVDGKRLAGSSFASPVITGNVAKMLKNGFDTNEIKDIITKMDTVTVSSYEYPLFNQQELNQKIDFYKMMTLK